MSNRGAVLAMTLTFALGFTMLALAIFQMTGGSGRYAISKAGSSQAFWAAEAGLQKGRWEYASNNCTGLFQSGTTTHCVSCLNCAAFDRTLSESTNGNNGDYDIKLDSLNANLKSTGYYPNKANALSIRTVQLDSDSLFRNALYGKGQVTVGNNVTIDSYTSDVGPYGGTNIYQNGGVGSNGTTLGVINLGNNSTVNGNVGTGAGGTVVLGGGATVTGNITHDKNSTLPDVIVPASLTSLSSEGAKNINTDTTISGDHKYTTMNINNNKTLTISGVVNLYLTSTFTTGNNISISIPIGSKLNFYVDNTFIFGNNPVINNVSQVAANFMIYSTYSGTNGVSLSNNANSAIGVYAPNTGVAITNNGDFFGAVIGKTVTISGSAISRIHFDQALAGGGSFVKWSEIF